MVIHVSQNVAVHQGLVAALRDDSPGRIENAGLSVEVLKRLEISEADDNTRPASTNQSDFAHCFILCTR